MSVLLVGEVRPPANMVEAARASLTRAGFEELLRTTEGKAPTSAQLVAAVEAERARGVSAPH